MSSFIQAPPQLGKQYADDRVLRGYLARTLSEEEMASAAPALERMGAAAGGELYAQQLAERSLEPVLEQWDAWGNRIDRITVTPLWPCPLAMTDGAARTLLASGNRALIERAVPHLTSRDPARFWTSGQWMTEAIGGSDVGLAETVSRSCAPTLEASWPFRRASRAPSKWRRRGGSKTPASTSPPSKPARAASP